MQYPPKPKRELLVLLGQRMRLHILNCAKHWDTRILKYFDGQTAFNLDYEYQHPRVIYESLRSSMYIPYSCILILINTHCNCGSRLLREVLQNMKQNRHLRYKAKLIICGYLLNEFYRSQKDLLVGELILKKYAEKNKTCEDIFLHSRFSKLDDNVARLDNITEMDKAPLRDYDHFLKSNVDNALFLQMFNKEHLDKAHLVDITLYWLDIMPFISVNELYQNFDFQVDFLVHSCRSVDYYFYSINPALAIIVNNYYFTNSLQVRQGSEQDVERLIRELKVAQIPFILIQDCVLQEILQIVDYMKSKDFHSLQKFYFFHMSHGGADNVVYTQDGQLNFVTDIVQPIESNSSLRDTQKFFISTMCRGPINMVYADFDDLEHIQQPTDNGFLPESSTVLYSVPNGVASPRDITTGTPFMQSLCNNFRNMDASQDISHLHNNINRDLKTVYYYRDLDIPSDLVVGNKGSRSCCLLPLRTEAKQMIKLMDSIIEDFPKFQSDSTIENGYAECGDSQYKTLFYICGALKRLADPAKQLSFVEKYLKPELDTDICEI